MSDWTKMPKEAYVIQYNGQTIGPALLTENLLPGVWNITFLALGEHLEMLSEYTGDPGDFPISFKVTPAIVGTSFQSIDGKSLGEWAEELTPAQWLKKANRTEDLIVEKVFPRTLELMAITAKKHNSRQKNNLLVVDFTRRRRIL